MYEQEKKIKKQGNTKNTDESIEKSFAKNAYNSEKINLNRFTKSFPSQDIYFSSKKLLKFWHFVSPLAPIPHSDMLFKEQ